MAAAPLVAARCDGLDALLAAPTYLSSAAGRALLGGLGLDGARSLREEAAGGPWAKGDTQERKC
jgi:hypothetical protein